MQHKNKNCKRCGLGYSPVSGHQEYCVSCGVTNTKEYKKKYFQEHKKEALVYQRKQRQIPEVKARKEEYDKKYRQNHKGQKKEYRTRNPKKVKAHNMANYWLKNLKSPGFEFHHPDYSQPLLVEVLPIMEHHALHAQLRQKQKI